MEEKVKSDNLKNVHILHGDLDSHASLTAAAQKTSEITGGVVDYLVTNGVYYAVPIMGNSVEEFIGKEDEMVKEFDQAFNTNVLGAMFAFNAFMPLVLKSSIKRVAAISSAAADWGLIFHGEDLVNIPYATSKAALNTLVAKYAARYKHDGVIFLSISPGFVATHDDIPKEVLAQATASLYRFDKALKGPMKPYQSVEMCLKVLNELKPEQSGQFLSQHGNNVWLSER